MNEGLQLLFDWRAVCCAGVVRASKFSMISSLTVHVSRNWGADFTCISFLGLKGEGTTARRGVVECTYEATASLKDHTKTRADKDSKAANLF
jgi:hypothetical protein